MKKKAFVICLFIIVMVLCFCGCTGETTVAESTMLTTDPNTPLPFDDSPPAIIDGQEKIGALGEPFDDEVIENILSDKEFIRKCDLTYGAGYHLADHGFYPIDLQRKSILYYSYNIPVIRNDLMIGWISIWYTQWENGGDLVYFAEYNPRVEDPEYPIDRFVHLLCLEKINPLLKENPKEYYLFLSNRSDSYLLDSNNVLHSVQLTGSDDITIVNQDILYLNYYVEEATISADMITSG